uniref:Uncharacterized protein n=1 Tax=Romanomermis culicivorax TaxID=13658 RepID=A0A915HU67_ROMCU
MVASSQQRRQDGDIVTFIMHIADVQIQDIIFTGRLSNSLSQTISIH